MALPMRSTDFRAIVEPILNEEFNGVYEQRDDEYKQIFHVREGIKRNYHEEVFVYGMVNAPEMPDGTPVSYSSGGVLYVGRAVYRVYGLAFALTKVLVEDGDHISIGSTFATHLAQSMIETKETLAANILNLGFNSAYPIGDGSSLFASNHLTAYGAGFSNIAGTPAAFSQTSLEQMLIQIRSATDPQGKRIRLKPQELVIPSALEFQAEAVLKSVLRTSSAENDINPVKSMGLLQGGAKVFTRLTSSTAWHVTTDANTPRQGLQLLTRRALEKSMEGDFETDSMRYKSTERYAFLVLDPRKDVRRAGVTLH